MKINFLGTGCGRPTAQRFNTSMAFEYDERIFMMDCGEPCTALLKRQGLSPGMVTDIFISHMHCDHVSGLPMLLREIWKSRVNGEASLSVEDRVNLYVPSCANPSIMEAVNIISGSPRNVNSFAKLVNLHSLESNAVIEREGFSVIPYRNTLPDEIESYAFLIRVDDLRLFYSGDLSKNFETIEAYLNDLDLLILESSHVKLKTSAIELQGKDIRKIVLTHLRWLYHGEEEKVLANVREYFSQDDVSIAHDGLVIELD